MPAHVRATLEAIVDVEQLKALRQRVLEVGSWDELIPQRVDFERLIRKKENYVIEVLAVLTTMVFIGFLAWDHFGTVPETLLVAFLAGVFVVAVSRFLIWWFNRHAARLTAREKPFTGHLNVTDGADGKPTEAECPKCKGHIKMGQGNGQSWFVFCKCGFSTVYIPPARAAIESSMIKRLPAPLQPPPTRETSGR
jgi:hypothetical protein